MRTNWCTLEKEDPGRNSKNEDPGQNIHFPVSSEKPESEVCFRKFDSKKFLPLSKGVVPRDLAIFQAGDDLQETPPPIDVRWRAALSLREAIDIEKETKAFIASLSPPERIVFRRGHRLSKAHRDALLAKLPPGEAIARGLRFSDEPGPVYEPPRGYPSDPHPEPSKLRLWPILMDAWHLVDPLDLELIADGILHGINMGYNGPRSACRILPNLRSAKIHSRATLSLIEKSIARGYVVGWFKDPQFDNLITNPVGVVDKPGSNPPFRLIEDFSQPEEESINDWTDDMVLVYDRIDAAIQHFARHGPGCVMIVFDKKSAYPSIHVREADHHLLGIHWPGKGYAHGRVMKFGAKRSAGIWECFGSIWQSLILEKTDADNCTRWVDDSFSCCSRELAELIVEQILLMARRYNFTLDRAKFTASEIAKFVGIIFNSLEGSLSIPPEKLSKASDLLRSLVHRAHWSKHQLQSILGVLFHFTSILPHCRGFLSRLLATLKASRRRVRVKVTDWMRSDISMWIAILEHWTGTSLAAVRAARQLALPAEGFTFDASPLFGIGIVCDSGEWISVPFTAAQLQSSFVDLAYSSTILEAYALLAILIHFPDLVQGIPIRATTDAKNIELTARKGYSTTPVVDDIFRMHAALQCKLDSIVVVSQVSRAHNQLADALSKNEIDRFKRLADARELSVRASARVPRFAPPWLSQIGPSAFL